MIVPTRGPPPPPPTNQIGDKARASDVLLDDEPLDPPAPLALVLNKPVGYVVTSPDDERVLDPVVYDLLPHRWGLVAVASLGHAVAVWSSGDAVCRSHFNGCSSRLKLEG